MADAVPHRTRQTEARIARAIAAWTAAGLAVGGVEVAPDGTVRITAPPAVPVDSTPESPQPAPRKWSRR